MGKLTISMAMFHSYVSLPEGMHVLMINIFWIYRGYIVEIFWKYVGGILGYIMDITWI